MLYRTQRPTVAEFFAGIGLVRMGLEAEGFDVVFANDIDFEDQTKSHTKPTLVSRRICLVRHHKTLIGL